MKTQQLTIAQAALALLVSNQLTVTAADPALNTIHINPAHLKCNAGFDIEEVAKHSSHFIPSTTLVTWISSCLAADNVAGVEDMIRIVRELETITVEDRTWPIGSTRYIRDTQVAEEYLNDAYVQYIDEDRPERGSSLDKAVEMIAERRQLDITSAYTLLAARALVSFNAKLKRNAVAV